MTAGAFSPRAGKRIAPAPGCPVQPLGMVLPHWSEGNGLFSYRLGDGSIRTLTPSQHSRRGRAAS